ncbi:MAG: NADPH:quinone oxidoreductase family protein [Myxococcota bacterium]
MRAALITELNGPDGIEVRELPDPQPGKGEVRIRVESAGVNFPDLLMSRGLYQVSPPPPFPPGGEVAGVIDAVGEGVERLAVGDRVMGTMFFGGFATLMCLPEVRVTKLPESMDTTTAGAFSFTYATSYHGLVDRGALARGERLLVLGAAGGVGLAAVEIGRALGAEVVAAASTDEKLALCRERGATHTINYTTQDLGKTLKAMGGVDVVYDPVGGDYAETALRRLRPDGRFLVIGFAAGSIPKIGLNLPLLKECQIVGVAWGAWTMRHPDRHDANLKALFHHFEAGEVKPHVSHRYRLDEVPDALRAMDERRVLGKVVIEPQ